MDVNTERSSKDITQQFFALKGTEVPAVLKVVAALKKQNDLTGFVAGFAKKEGFAIWDKSIVRQQTPTNYQRDGGEEIAEILVFIPIVETDSNFVNGFFFSRIVGDSVALHLYRANDYDQYPYGNIDTSFVTAERIALQIAELNLSTFGHRKHLIKDSFLFSECFKYPVGTGIRTMEIKSLTGSFSGNNLVAVAQGNTIFCQSASCPPGEPGGTVCFNCYQFNLTVLMPEEPYQWPPDFPTGSGEGGGGGSPQNPDPGNNCTGSNTCGQLRSLIAEGRLPCGGCGPGPVVVVPMDESPNIYPNSDSLLADISRSIKRKADSIFNLSTQQNYNEWGMIIVRKNGVIYAKNEKTDNDPNYVKFNWFLQTGEELIGDFHVHNDSDSLGRSSFSGDDLTALRRNKSKYQYVKFVDCGNIRYAFIIEDVGKANTFFSENKETKIIDTVLARAYRHPSRYINWQYATQAIMENYIGLSSVNGIGFYMSNNGDKTSYTKLN